MTAEQHDRLAALAAEVATVREALDRLAELVAEARICERDEHGREVDR